MNVKKGLFGFLLIVFTGFSHVDAQESYNYYALEYFKKGLECLVSGDYDNAILNCSQVLIRDPNSAVTYTIRARSYYEKGDMAKAIDDCSKAINIDKNNISAFIIRAKAYLGRNDNTRAGRDWLTVLRLDPHNAEAKQFLEQVE
ncbi:MAG: hypothetical protein FWC19_02235 [Treponema sp.]|nr:hypothetical protein [Treponema sp.]